MKLAMIATPQGAHLGVVTQDGLVIDMNALDVTFPGAAKMPVDIEEALEFGSLERVREGADRALKTFSRSDGLSKHIFYATSSITWLPPLSRPRLIVSSGGAYRSHLTEMATAQWNAPAGFIKSSASIVGPGQPVLLPTEWPSMVDWEGEFCCVIGKPCHRVTEEEALNHVAGYTLINDVSARDWVADFLGARGTPMEIARRGQLNHMGKQFPTFCPIGPCVVTKDEIPDPSALEFSTRVNGELMQHGSTADLIFSLARTISYFSRWYRFLPGDVISTGTPSGVGYGMTPQRFLRDGDVVEVHMEQIGTLSNPVRHAEDH